MTNTARDIPQLTIAVCTHNRFSHVDNLLPCLKNQITNFQFEILVVENSTDEEELSKFKDKYEHDDKLRVVFADKPGLSNARNIALKQSLADYIAYIDDDAIPDQDWVEQFCQAISNYKPDVLAGPIVPKFPDWDLNWLPEKYLPCLAILDLGSDDRRLLDNEFAYGANMCFRKEALLATDGFSQNLGRTGTVSLLSDEEIEVQQRIKDSGGTFYYAAKASVTHNVHEDRLSRTYFRSRMAWQGVSSLLRDPPFQHRDWSVAEVSKAARVLGVEDLVQKLFYSASGKELEAQIDLAYHLTALFLDNKSATDSESSAYFRELRVLRSEEPQLDSNRKTGYGSSCYFDHRLKSIVLDGTNSHDFILNTLAESQNVAAIKLDLDLWQDNLRAMTDLSSILNGNLETCTLVTLDPFLFAGNYDNFVTLLGHTDTKVSGILHRVPSKDEDWQKLKKAADLMQTVYVLAPALRNQLEDRKISNGFYLPLAPTVEPLLKTPVAEFKQQLGILPNHKVMGLIGEARDGKGFELLMPALRKLSAMERKNVFILAAGTISCDAARNLNEEINLLGVSSFLDLREKSGSFGYKSVSDFDLARYIACCDAGLFFYQRQQAIAMSGNIANFSLLGKPCFGIKNTVVGDVIEANSIGYVSPDDTVDSITGTISEFLNDHQDWTQNPSMFEYNEKNSADNVRKLWESSCGIE